MIRKYRKTITFVIGGIVALLAAGFVALVALLGLEEPGEFRP